MHLWEDAWRSAMVAPMAPSIQTTLVFFLVFFGLKVVLRKEWIAAIVFIAHLCRCHAD